MTTTSSAMVRIDDSFLSVTNMVLNYVNALQLQYGVSFEDGHIVDVGDDGMLSRYLLKLF